MNAPANFKLVLSGVASELASRGFRRKGALFTRQLADGGRFVCLHVRKIPQPGSKRIVFQIVAYSGPSVSGHTNPISSLEQVLAQSDVEHRLFDGNVEKFWTVWPSSDVEGICRLVNQRIVSCIEELEIRCRETERVGCA